MSRTRQLGASGRLACRNSWAETEQLYLHSYRLDETLDRATKR